MKWILIYIALTNVGPVAQDKGAYDSIMDCFHARAEMKPTQDQNPQWICLRKEEK